MRDEHNAPALYQGGAVADRLEVRAVLAERAAVKIWGVAMRVLVAGGRGCLEGILLALLVPARTEVGGLEFYLHEGCHLSPR
jgi:hypothetical protein